MSQRNDCNQVLRAGIPAALNDLGGIASGDSVKAWILNHENAQIEDWGRTPPNNKYPEGRYRFTESFTLVAVALKKKGSLFTPAWGWLSNDPSLTAPTGSPKVPKRTAEAPKTPPVSTPEHYDVGDTYTMGDTTYEVDAKGRSWAVSQNTSPSTEAEAEAEAEVEPIVEVEVEAQITTAEVEPVTEAEVEPLVEAEVEAEAQITTAEVEPIVEPIVEPVVEPEVEPIVEPVVEPIVEAQITAPDLSPLSNFDLVGATDDEYGYIALSEDSPVIRFPKSYPDDWKFAEASHKTLLSRASESGIEMYAKIIDRVATINRLSNPLGCFGSDSEQTFCSQCPLAPLCKRSSTINA